MKLLGYFLAVNESFFGGHYPSPWTGLMPAIITSEMTPNEFQMTLRPCEKHLVHLRTHLGSYWGSFWLLMIVFWAGIIPVHGLG